MVGDNTPTFFMFTLPPKLPTFNINTDYIEHFTKPNELNRVEYYNALTTILAYHTYFLSLLHDFQLFYWTLSYQLAYKNFIDSINFMVIDNISNLHNLSFYLLSNSSSSTTSLLHFNVDSGIVGYTQTNDTTSFEPFYTFGMTWYEYSCLVNNQPALYNRYSVVVSPCGAVKLSRCHDSLDAYTDLESIDSLLLTPSFCNGALVSLNTNLAGNFITGEEGDGKKIIQFLADTNNIHIK